MEVCPDKAEHAVCPENLRGKKCLLFVNFLSMEGFA
jgi:hypothetical protein